MERTITVPALTMATVIAEAEYNESTRPFAANRSFDIRELVFMTRNVAQSHL